MVVEHRDYICDRCGRKLEFDFRNRWIRHVNSYKLLIFGIQINWHSYNNDVDLCEDCSDSFIHWFKNPEKDSKEANGKP